MVAKLDMEHFKHVALGGALLKPSCFLHYVDNTFLIWPHGTVTLDQFFQFLYNLHPNIRFTMEDENGSGLSFLDVFVYS